MRRLGQRTIGICLVLALLATSCGSDSDDDEPVTDDEETESIAEADDDGDDDDQAGAVAQSVDELSPLLMLGEFRSTSQEHADEAAESAARARVEANRARLTAQLFETIARDNNANTATAAAAQHAADTAVAAEDAASDAAAAAADAATAATVAAEELDAALEIVTESDDGETAAAELDTSTGAQAAADAEAAARSAAEAAAAAAGAGSTASDIAVSACPDLLGDATPSSSEFSVWWDQLNHVQQASVWAEAYLRVYPENEYATHYDNCGAVVCAYTRNEIITTDVLPSDDQFAGLEDTTTDDLERVGLKRYAVSVDSDFRDRILDLAVAISEGGELEAAPNYVVTPAMGRMFFPGGFPQPFGERFADRPITDPTVVINLLDTGFWDGTGELAKANSAGTNAEDMYTYRANPSAMFWTGHGSFIASVIHSHNPSALVQHWRVNEQDSLAWTEDTVLAQALKARDHHDGSSDENPMISNLSLGTVACEHDEVTAVADDQIVGLTEPATPLIWRKILEVLLKNPGDVVIAAAGNTGDETVSYPASYTADPDLGSQVLSVGAPESYSTQGDGVDLVAEGCHTGIYVDREYTYPVPPHFDGPQPPTIEFANSTALWCGTSFSAAVVTAAVAREVGAGVSAVDTIADVHGLDLAPS